MKKILRSSAFGFGLFTVLLAVTMIVMVSCGEQTQAPVEPEESQEVAVLSQNDPAIQAVLAIQDRHTDNLMRKSGVVGVATGESELGQAAIIVMVENKAALKGLPETLEGVPVRGLITGKITAIKGGPGGGFDPTAKHRPAPNGVSLGHFNITAGTLGCLVTRNSTTYILSNNHVMADENNASIGDNILQPGPFDGGQNPADRIAQLSAFKTIIFSTSANNVIDAAIAAVNPADVTGETVTYGPPRSTTVAAAVRMRVAKYGRTTEQTSGRVQGINATVNVGYDSGTARYVNQIVIGGGSFSAGGDSGSLIIASRGSDQRKPVGLLFAGGGGVTIANPIDAVLSEFGVSVVGD